MSDIRKTECSLTSPPLHKIRMRIRVSLFVVIANRATREREKAIIEIYFLHTQHI